MEFDHFNITHAEGVTLLVATQRDVKKTGGVAKAMDRRGVERTEGERCDPPTTSISHKWRGSALAARRAGREDGGGRKGCRVESGVVGRMAYASGS